jgi:hypothetical protein
MSGDYFVPVALPLLPGHVAAMSASEAAAERARVAELMDDVMLRVHAQTLLDSVDHRNAYFAKHGHSYVPCGCGHASVPVA